jgi:hypothetical protein
MHHQAAALTFGKTFPTALHGPAKRDPTNVAAMPGTGNCLGSMKSDFHASRSINVSICQGSLMAPAGAACPRVVAIDGYMFLQYAHANAGQLRDRTSGFVA